MMSRDEARALRRYLNDGGVVYPGLCRYGSFLIHRLALEKLFESKDEVACGR